MLKMSKQDYVSGYCARKDCLKQNKKKEHFYLNLNVWCNYFNLHSIFLKSFNLCLNQDFSTQVFTRVTEKWSTMATLIEEPYSNEKSSNFDVLVCI